jgi:antibiotic biosynthesis monooxygenase (ABM) superfamily enzyme
LCLLNPAVLVVIGLFKVLGALRQILLSYLVHMHSRLRSLRQGLVHVGPITWEVLPQIKLLTKDQIPLAHSKVRHREIQ